MSATELFIALFRAVKIKDFRWWPGFGSFEVVVGAILIQNTAWRNADAALQNLRSKGLLSLDGIAELDEAELAKIIKASGFYNQKARRLSLLCKAIIADFGDFESFKSDVSREWLLARKGIGAESCDAILCYACERAVMVADSYSARLLGALGYEFESYDELSAWLGELEFERIYEFVNFANSPCYAAAKADKLENENGVYALFHGLIVEFCKAHLKSKIFDDFAMEFFDNLK
ncbi:3-methyladenine DNA glycosylase [uncultured Campylobacter sp.]|mgnify:FL=1|uniref:3-methyladenine DNA glycosylase n=1 Tax=uncultured Campylobacter sp. TaxID=218934 RepID=UPI002623D23F|nr:3-methyladenine DNA glycosylase [uncultured Campylobacter sp.]